MDKQPAQIIAKVVSHDHGSPRHRPSHPIQHFILRIFTITLHMIEREINPRLTGGCHGYPQDVAFLHRPARAPSFTDAVVLSFEVDP